MNIKPLSNDIHIDMGRINGTIAIEIDGRPHAINFSMTVEDAERAATDDIQTNITIVDLSEDSSMSAERQAEHIRRHFKAALNLTDDQMIHVWFTDDEEIVVQIDQDRSRQWTFYIPSDDDGFYYFELWVNGRRDDGCIDLKFPYPTEA